MESEHAANAALLKIEPDGFHGEQVGWDRIAAKGVADQEIKIAVGHLFQRHAAVARQDTAAAAAVAEVGEQPWVGGNANHGGIDFQEGEFLPRLGIAGQRAGPQTDDRHALPLRATLERLEHLPDRRRVKVIGQGNPPPGGIVV